MDKEEIWRDIPGFSYYKVSNIGRIKRKSRDIIDKLGRTTKLKERILNIPNAYQKNRKPDYCKINIVRDNGKKFALLIHRAVTMAFIPNPENLPEVDHIDSNRANNSVENLQWVTKMDNMKKAVVSGHKGVNNINAKLTEKNVEEICNCLCNNETKASIAKKFNVSEQVIGFIAKKKYWSHLDCVKNLPESVSAQKSVKHSTDEIQRIKNLILSGMSNTEIASLTGNSRRYINYIRNK